MSKYDKPESKLHYAWRLFKNEGVLAVIIRILQKIQKMRNRTGRHKKPLLLLGNDKDILEAEWSGHGYAQPKGKVKLPGTIAWVMSPPGESGGGHQNIFRFIKFLDAKGYRNYIYLYSSHDRPSLGKIKDEIKGFYDLELSNVEWLDDDKSVTIGDAVFATGWETAYPVYNSKLNVKKFYFVQDFEPYFYPVGSEYILAENTYKFGLIGITAGKWLAQKLSKEYGMETHYYDFGTELKLYNYVNDQKRKEVFFYARPITARRGFELGIMTLEKFHKMHPDYTINLAGWDVSEYDIPFPYVNHKALKLHELSELYNKCAAALVVSLTNMSLMPLELLSTGAIPVVNDASNNRLVSDNPYIKYAAPSPGALAQAMHEVVTAKDQVEHAKKAAQSVTGNRWADSGAKFIRIIEEQLGG